ncbi:MAG: AsmA-like C-terminal region-containing protein [Chitinophagales bacterium]
MNGRLLLKIIAAFLLVVVALVAAAGWYVRAHQAELITAIEKEMNKSVKGHITVGKVRLGAFRAYTGLALHVEGFSISDSVYKKEVFHAGALDMKVELLPLLRMKIEMRSLHLSDAVFSILKDTNGYSNANLFRTSSEKNTNDAANIHFEEVSMENVRFVLTDEIQKQHLSFVLKELDGDVRTGSEGYQMKMNGWIAIDSMMFKQEKGSFFVGERADLDLKMNFDPKKLLFTIYPSKVKMSGQWFDAWGSFNANVNPVVMDLNFSNPAVNYAQGRSVLSAEIKKYMNDIMIESPVGLKIRVNGPIIPLYPPDVDVNFVLNKAKATLYGQKVTDLSLTGKFTNHLEKGVRNDDYNSGLFFNVTQVNLSGIQASATLAVRDLKQLRSDIRVKANTALPSLNQFLPDENYGFNSGNASVDIAYRGSLWSYLDSVNHPYNDTLNLFAGITNGGFIYRTRNIRLNNIAAEIAVADNDLLVRNMSADLNENPVRISGELKRIRRLIADDKSHAEGHFEVHAHDFDLTKILTEKQMKQLQQTAEKKTTANHDIKKVQAMIDDLTNRLSVNLAFHANTFRFRKFMANQIHGMAALSVNGMALKNFEMNACDGRLQINGGLNTAGAKDRLEAAISLQHINVKQFLEAAEDFNQKAVTHENISGILSTNVWFAANLDPKYLPEKESMLGNMYFSLKNGKLTGFDAVKEIGSKIFRKRDFDNITFAEIKDSLILSGQELRINRMEIASSVMHLFVQGRYQFNGESTIGIQVPLSNLKTIPADFKPENIGADKRGGASIFLLLTGANNKMKVKLDTEAGARKRFGKPGG